MGVPGKSPNPASKRRWMTSAEVDDRDTSESAVLERVRRRNRVGRVVARHGDPPVGPGSSYREILAPTARLRDKPLEGPRETEARTRGRVLVDRLRSEEQPPIGTWQGQSELEAARAVEECRRSRSPRALHSTDPFWLGWHIKDPHLQGKYSSWFCVALCSPVPLACWRDNRGIITR